MHGLSSPETPKELQKLTGTLENIEETQVTSFEDAWERLHMMSEKVADAARNDEDCIETTHGGDVGASGERPAAPGQEELNPGAPPQAQRRA